MNRITKLFKTKKQNILSIYFTAGYPALNDTIRIINALDKAGVDLIEIGMPFSDPIADGKIIQKSNDMALSNGMSMKLLFNQLKNIRNSTDIPLILMGYFNPFYKYGIENFLNKCKETGIDGIIIPDLPLEEYLDSYQKLFEEQDIINIFLISPQTPEKRIIRIDSISKGFIYIVSSHGTTGASKSFDQSHLSYFQKIVNLNLKNPGLIGFGISDNETFKLACNYANGAIIGSSFIKSINEQNDLSLNVERFVRQIRA